MTKFSSRKFNNKGAALVAIMIAVAFISIVASTLLVLSVNNFQMKAVANESRDNFYVTEQDINIMSVQLRNAAKNSSSDGVSDVTDLISNDGMSIDDKKLCKLVYPAATSDTFVDSTGSYTFSHTGNILKETNVGGTKVTIKGVGVKHIDPDGYENTIRTDMVLYIERAVAGGAVSGVGDCSFLLDNNLYIDGNANCTRINIYGNSIMGNYHLVNGKSEPYTIPVNSNSINVNNVNNSNVNGSPACTLLLRPGYDVNLLGDYTVIIGDVYISDKSVLNVCRGDFTVFGNIFVSKSGSFICAGNLHLGNGGHIYSVDTGNGTIVEVTKTQLDSHNHKYLNCFVGSTFDNLPASAYADIRSKLSLDDNDESNDGVLPHILKKSPHINNGNGYIYNLKASAQDFSKTKFYFNGEEYNVDIAQGDLNGSYQHKLLIVPASVNGGYTKLTNSILDCTIISKKPAMLYETHNASVSMLGGECFNTFLKNPNKFKAQQDSNSNVTEVTVGECFDANCNNFVQSIFSISIGANGGAASGVTDTAMGFKNWYKQ